MADFRLQLAKIRDALFPRPKLCSKKVRYATPGYAQGVLNRRQKEESAQLYLYRCSACDGWHITKMAQPESESSVARGKQGD